MESDLVRLNGMIDRLLRIARLDSAAVPMEMTTVNMTDLVGRIVDDAGFEAQERNVVVNLAAPEQCYARGNAALRWIWGLGGRPSPSGADGRAHHVVRIA
jgi:signal transduction histidine kinase